MTRNMVEEALGGYERPVRKVIEYRDKHEVNTDPQRRCYNGAHYSSAIVWGPWIELDHFATEERLQWWRDLNEYAVQARGESARSEYRIAEKYDA